MISACAIVGSEPLYLKPWVKHLQRVPQIKEINIVYNQDKPDIDGVNLKYHPNRYNFSEWRNRSILMAKEQWILVLDIDEFLSYELIEEISQLLGSGCNFIKARRMDFWNQDQYREDLLFQKYYLFKNDINIFYARPLHEELCFKHGNRVEDVHPVHIIENKAKVHKTASPVYHYSLTNRNGKKPNRPPLYRTIRYLNNWDYAGDRMNKFDRKGLMEHIRREAEKGMVLKKFEGKHPEELKEIL